MSQTDQELHDILASQNADGSFSYERFGDPADIRQIVEEIRDMLGSDTRYDELKCVTSSVLAMLTLQTRFADQRRLTKRAYRKGRRYLVKVFGLKASAIEARLDRWRAIFV